MFTSLRLSKSTCDFFMRSRTALFPFSVLQSSTLWRSCPSSFSLLNSVSNHSPVGSTCTSSASFSIYTVIKILQKFCGKWNYEDRFFCCQKNFETLCSFFHNMHLLLNPCPDKSKCSAANSTFSIIVSPPGSIQILQIVHQNKLFF